MATLRGSRIRPELANADFSGIARGGRMQGQALANLGGDIAGGIKKYQINKQTLLETIGENEAIVNANPEFAIDVKEGNATPELKKILEQMESGNINLSGASMLNRYYKTLEKQKQAKTESENVRLNQQILQSKVNEVKRQETLRNQRQKFDKLVLNEVQNRAEGDETKNYLKTGVMK